MWNRIRNYTAAWIRIQIRNSVFTDPVPAALRACPLSSTVFLGSLPRKMLLLIHPRKIKMKLLDTRDPNPGRLREALKGLKSSFVQIHVKKE